MTAYPPQGQITEADVRAAQTALDVIREGMPHADTVRDETWLVMRGWLVSWAAEVREAGYTEGLLRGRRDVAGWVRDALAGEGL